MLHTISFDMGRAAGIVAYVSGKRRPESHLDIPGLMTVLTLTEDMFFFPSSYIEGYLAAWDHPGHKFCSLDRLSDLAKKDPEVYGTLSSDYKSLKQDKQDKAAA